MISFPVGAVMIILASRQRSCFNKKLLMSSAKVEPSEHLKHWIVDYVVSVSATQHRPQDYETN